MTALSTGTAFLVPPYSDTTTAVGFASYTAFVNHSVDHPGKWHLVTATLIRPTDPFSYARVPGNPVHDTFAGWVSVLALALSLLPLLSGAVAAELQLLCCSSGITLLC